MRTAALREISRRTLGVRLSVGSHFTSSWSNGTAIKVTEPDVEKKVQGTLAFTVENKTEVVPATPVQMLPNEKDRKGLRYLVPIIASWFKVKGQEVKLALTPNELADSFKESVFDYRGIPMFADTVVGIFNPKTGYLVSGGRTLSGWSWVQHVKDVLLGCSFSEYYTLQTSFVYDVLMPKDDGRGAKTNFIELKDSDRFPADLRKTIKELSDFVGGCYFLSDAFTVKQSPRVAFTNKKTRIAGREEGFARARAGVQRVRAVLGESLAHYRLIEDGRSYTSMMSNAEREIIFLVSTSLGLMGMGKNVQIMLSSVGPMEFVFSSIRKWQTSQRKLGSKDPKFVFVLPSKAATSVQTVYADYVVTSPVPDYVLLWNHSSDVAADQDVETALSKAEDIFQGFTGVDDYVLKTGLYGKLLTDESHHIYRFGTAWEFQGLVSTIPNLSFMKANVKDDYRLVPAILVEGTGAERAELWYETVKAHCTLMLSAPYRCPIYVSEACNLVAAQRERVKMTFNVTGDVEFTTLTTEDQLSELSGFDFSGPVKKPRVSLATIMKAAGRTEEGVTSIPVPHASSLVDIDGDVQVKNEVALPGSNSSNVSPPKAEEEEQESGEVSANLAEAQAGEY
jgi:hypothetical protein